ncbi:B2L15 protein, partial [Psilopogon haemacephalus]|nr:B2L15 protein [Psilopogon haemacephalus]
AAMVTFEEQTACVVQALFSDLFDEDEIDCRSLQTDSAECARSAAGPPLPFDVRVVASRLRQMGDQCNLDFERVSSKPLAELLQGKKFRLLSLCLQVEKFGAAVESAIRRWNDQNPELVYERAFLCVCVKLVKFIGEKVPEVLDPILLIREINGNAQVRNYIEAHGGWVRM